MDVACQKQTVNNLSPRWKWRMIIAVIFFLSNWKEEAWKKSGLQRDSNPWPPWYRCDALPTELWSCTLGARSINWVHIFPWGVKWCEVYMKSFIFELSHHFTPHGKIWTQLIDLAPNVRLQSSVGRASHRTAIAEVTGSNPVEALIFFRLLLSICLNWKIYCDDQSSLSSTTAVQIWIISYILHNLSPH